VIERRRLLGEHRRPAHRADDDVGHQLDPLGHVSRGAQRHQRVVAVVDEAVDHGKAIEAGSLGASSPRGDRRPVDAVDRAWQPDRDACRGGRRGSCRHAGTSAMSTGSVARVAIGGPVI
jgi:hypothetical protein